MISLAMWLEVTSVLQSRINIVFWIEKYQSPLNTHMSATKVMSAAGLRIHRACQIELLNGAVDIPQASSRFSPDCMSAGQYMPVSLRPQSLGALVASSTWHLLKVRASIFHKKFRASRGGQEKSERKNSERTRDVNPTYCGPRIG